MLRIFTSRVSKLTPCRLLICTTLLVCLLIASAHPYQADQNSSNYDKSRSKNTRSKQVKNVFDSVKKPDLSLVESDGTMLKILQKGPNSDEDLSRNIITLPSSGKKSILKIEKSNMHETPILADSASKGYDVEDRFSAINGLTMDTNRTDHVTLHDMGLTTNPTSEIARAQVRLNTILRTGIRKAMALNQDSDFSLRVKVEKTEHDISNKLIFPTDPYFVTYEADYLVTLDYKVFMNRTANQNQILIHSGIVQSGGRHSISFNYPDRFDYDSYKVVETTAVTMSQRKFMEYHEERCIIKLLQSLTKLLQDSL